MTVLITGATGFSGVKLSEFLPANQLRVGRSLEDIRGSDFVSKKLDLLNVDAIQDLIMSHQPKQIYHLAGSFTNCYEKDFEINVTATKNLLDMVKDFSINTRVLLIGSAAEYGLISKEQCPVNENFKLNPCNIYGLSKIYQKYLMDYYVNVFDLDLVMARPFNLYGKGISENLFVGKIYSEIEKFKSGLIKEISLGNLESERDYILIDDAVKHYVKIMESGVRGQIYNVGTGIPIKTSDILKKILLEEDVDIKFVKSGQRAEQSNDSDKIYANIAKLEGLYHE